MFKPTHIVNGVDHRSKFKAGHKVKQVGFFANCTAPQFKITQGVESPEEHTEPNHHYIDEDGILQIIGVSGVDLIVEGSV
jgi:hypothetical protein